MREVISVRLESEEVSMLKELLQYHTDMTPWQINRSDIIRQCIKESYWNHIKSNKMDSNSK